jgi:hypothetical protein
MSHDAEERFASHHEGSLESRLPKRISTIRGEAHYAFFWKDMDQHYYHVPDGHGSYSSLVYETVMELHRQGEIGLETKER